MTPHDEEEEAHAVRALEHIAAALGMPTAVFFDGAEGSPRLLGADELLRIWSDLRTDADRRKVLSFARAVAARSAEEG